MIIEKIEVTKPFKYIWLKTVEGINLSVHCARCLIGKYDNRINNKISQLNNLELDNSKIYYLCGVSKPYNWNNNFHLAFDHKKGSTIEYSSNGINVKIVDAEMLPISQEFIDSKDKNISNKNYTTCRNWQFANYLKREV